MPRVTLHSVECPECEWTLRVTKEPQWIHCVKCGTDFHSEDEGED